MDTSSVFEIEFSGHSTKREWAVYIIIVIDRKSANRKLYVGKVGDNRDGCNPMISRIGNHFSHNRIHSQLRNKVSDTTIFDYKILYSIFGEYNTNNRPQGMLKINTIERHLNLLVQKSILQGNIRENTELLNPYKGRKVLSKDELTTEENNKVALLASKAVKY